MNNSTKQLPLTISLIAFNKWILFFIIPFVIVIVSCIPSTSSPPFPEPMPLQGSIQITTDFSYYRDLMWSPSGNLIAAKRCPILDFEPRCFGSDDEIVFINVERREIQSLDFRPLESKIRLSQPITWSPDGTELLILITEQINDESTEFELRSRYVSYDPSSSSFRYLDIEGTVIAWGAKDTQFLIKQIGSDGRLNLGWYDQNSNQFIELFSLDLEVGLADYYALSPDQRFMLHANSLFPEDCEEISVYSLEANSVIIATLSDACFPAWSGDSTKIAYSTKTTQITTPSMVMLVNRDGKHLQRLINIDLPFGVSHPTWSPDAKKIAITYGGQGNSNSIHILDIPDNLRPQQ